jgi:GMP synthase (glutamine-hydrolysing)
VTDPETKRKAIGNEFIAVFDDEAKKIFEAEKPRAKRLRGWCRGRSIRT